jgi:hypothetical protein
LPFSPLAPDASLNYVVPGLTNGVLYSFKVSAVDSPYGEGALSAGVYGLPYVSATMNNLQVTPFNTSLNCNWLPATNQQFYQFSNQVTYILDISNNGIVNKYTGLDLSFNITSLTNGQFYNVLLSGSYFIPQKLFIKIQGPGVSPLVTGVPVSSSGTPRTVPGAPININYVSQTNSILTLTWNAPVSNGGNAISNYIVNRYLDASYAILDASFNTNSGQTLELTMQGLTPINYWFKVFAVNAAGTGIAGEAGPFVPFDNILPPTNVSVFQTGTNNAGPILQLEWTSTNTNVYTASKYSYYQCDINGVRIGNIFDVSANQFDTSNNTVPIQYNYKKTGILPVITSSSIYYYRIQAIQGNFISDIVQVSTPTGSLPVVTFVGIDSSLNSITFTVDNNGQPLSSVLVLVPPTSAVGAPVPYQLPTIINEDVATYSVIFGYPLLQPPQQLYLISATNSVGCAVVENFA